MLSIAKSLGQPCLLLLSIVLLTTGAVHAAIEGGDAGRGRVLTKEKCKYCHMTGAEGGTMTPLSKTQQQWERFYAKDKHNKLAPGAWDHIDPNELIDIMQFLYDHAADSPHPETCGQ